MRIPEDIRRGSDGRIVVVSQRVENIRDRSEIRDALDQNLIKFLLLAGYLPVPVPNSLNSSINDWLRVVQPMAVVLSGGGDIGQCVSRDATESALLEYAESLGLPLLGICRGMQMIAYKAGVSMRPVIGHVCSRHKLRGRIRTVVNSYHQFVIDGIPKDYDVLAYSDNGEIEAIQHAYLPWQGWMWHPEREKSIKDEDIARLRGLFG